MVGYIYIYTNKINNKVYVGQTTDLVSRKCSHRYKSTFEKSKFYNAVRKYGWKNFDFAIVAQVQAVTIEEIKKLLDTLEIEYIKQYDSFMHGYNSTAGGHCYRGKEVSDSFREYCKNRQYSKETRLKMSIAAKNRVVSDATKKKLHDNAVRRNFGKYRELTTKKRNEGIRKALAKKVLQIDEFDNIVNEFSTMKDAAQYVANYIAHDRTVCGIETGIRRHCKNKIKKSVYYGFKWKFKANV